MRDGHPITTLHLPHWTGVAPDLEALGEAKGLKVLYPYWKEGDYEWSNDRSGDLEYICGGVDRENSSDSV